MGTETICARAQGHRKHPVRGRVGFGVGTAFVGVWLFAAGALAADTAARDEIVVTARKRDEILANVPQAITVYRADDLAALGDTVSPELAQQTPNLMWHSILGFASPQIFLRGIGNATFNANQAGPVGLHIDGIYQGSSTTFGFAMFDLDRVEILKGPQGTLFGRNTTGGVINFISRKPDPADGFNAQARATYGHFNQIDVEAAGGFALGDGLAVRMAGAALNRDGYVKNRNPASGIDDQGAVQIWALRNQVRFVGENLDVLLNIHGGQNHSDVPPGKQLGVTCPAGVTVPRPGLCSDFFGFTDTANPRESFTNLPSYDNIDSGGVSADVTWTTSAFSIVSQTAFDANFRKLQNDSDAAPLPEVKTDVKARFHQFSQELRILSPQEQRFTWIAGGNYFADKLSAFQTFSLNAFPAGVISQFFPVPEGIAGALRQTTDSYAVFGEGNYAILPRLNITLGLRWTRDERAADGNAFLFDVTGTTSAFISERLARSRLLVTTIPAGEISRAWSRWSGRGVVSYNVTDDVLAYVSVARGFKGGDYNGGALLNPSQSKIVDPEYVTAYEIGAKASGLGGRLSVTASAFYYDFTNQQVSVLLPGSGATLQSLANAAKSRVKGLEADISVTPTDHLLLQLKTGFLDATFQHFALDAGNPALNYDGNRIASAPKFSLAGIARYGVPLGAGVLSAQTDFSYKSGHFFSVDNDPALYQTGYFVANGSLIYERANYSITAWVKNIGDANYSVSGLANTAFGFSELIPGLPRTFGLTVAAKF